MVVSVKIESRRTRVRRHLVVGGVMFAVALMLFMLAQTSPARADTWVSQESGTSSGLSSVFFVDEKTGWAVGEEGTILATVDGGERWTAQMSGTTEALYSVCFVDDQRGWAGGSGGTVLSTVDGGATWQSAVFTHAGGSRLADFSYWGQVHSIGFLPDGQGWIAGTWTDWTQCSLRVLRTLDYGRHWTEVKVRTGYSSVHSAAFSDELNGVAVGDGSLILQTSDGGSTWTRRYPTWAPHRAHFVDLDFCNADLGWIAGFYHWVPRTSDGGVTWVPSADGPPNTRAVSVCFADPGRGWVVGYDCDEYERFMQPVIYASEDGGITWNLELRDATPGSFISVYALDATHVWAVGNAGQIWTNSSKLNTDPQVTLPAGAIVQEGQLLEMMGSFADPDADEWTASVDYGDGSGPQELSLAADRSLLLSHTYKDNGEYTVSVVVHDNAGGSGTATTQASVTNVAPEISSLAGSIDPVRVGGSTTLRFAFTDPGTSDTHTWSFTWGDGDVTQSDAAGLEGSAAHSYSAPGVYTATLTLSDDDGGTTSKELPHYIVVYDPAGGFVTGGGWINSPAGAYSADPSLTGKATFGFEAKYKKGTTVPTGNTEFQFKAAGISFKSTAYDWLVVAGAKAQFKGIGSINGTGRYGFILTVVDGALLGRGKSDTFRVKIWDETGAIVYDNLRGAGDTADVLTAIGGGSIVVHR